MKKIFYVILFSLLASPMLAMAGMPGHMKYRMGSLEGQVFFDNNPVANATLAFFDVTQGLPPISGLSGRIPQFLGRTDLEGKFKVKLMQGSYYLGILLREAGAGFGPPMPDEVFYFADDGTGMLMKLSVEDFKEIDAGRINTSLPSVFDAKEDNFTVEGTVYREEGGEPFEGAVVLGKSVPTMRRPDYFSSKTGPDGKFSIQFPSGQTFYLVARKIITGKRPEAGESIGKYGVDSYSETSSTIPQTVGNPPPGVEKKETPRIVADSIPVTGASGEVITGVKIVMYEMPDQKKLQSENMRQADAPDYETGYAISNLYFAFDSAVLDMQAKEELDLWVNFFKGRRDLSIELIGHADNVGPEEYNQKLSERRAEAVAIYFADKGIHAGRISVRGVGEGQPIADNTTEEGRTKNRRVDIKFEK